MVSGCVKWELSEWLPRSLQVSPLLPQLLVCARAEKKGYLRLTVVLDAHGEDVDADDEGDEEVQVVAGAQCVDGQAQGEVVGVVGPLLGLWRTQTGHTESNSE